MDRIVLPADLVTERPILGSKSAALHPSPQSAEDETSDLATPIDSAAHICYNAVKGEILWNCGNCAIFWR